MSILPPAHEPLDPLEDAVYAGSTQRALRAASERWGGLSASHVGGPVLVTMQSRSRTRFGGSLLRGDFSTFTEYAAGILHGPLKYAPPSLDLPDGRIVVPLGMYYHGSLHELLETEEPQEGDLVLAPSRGDQLLDVRMRFGEDVYRLFPREFMGFGERMDRLRG